MHNLSEYYLYQTRDYEKHNRYIFTTSLFTNRSDRLNKGLRGLFDRLTGTAKQARSRNEREAMACAKRDQQQRDRLVVAQMKERRELQKKASDLKDKQKQDRHLMMRDIVASLRRLRKPPDKDQSRTRRRGFSLSR